MGIFFSTPDILIKYGQDIYAALYDEQGFQISTEARVVLVLLVARGIQQLTCYWVRKLGYYRQSIINREMLKAASLYLITILLIFPFFGQLSISLVLQLIVVAGPERQQKFVEAMECVFLPEGGLSFVHYLMSAATLGNAIELLRPLDIVTYLYRLSSSGTNAEVLSWLKKEKISLWFGDYYSYDILHLYISVALCTAAPLAAPFGLFYFIIKHFVSTYTLKQAWTGTKMDIDFHRCTTSFVVGAALAAQLCNTLLICLRSPHGNQVAYAAAFISIFSCMFFAVEVSSKWRWPVPVWPQDLFKVRGAKETSFNSSAYCPAYARFLFEVNRKERM